MMQLFIRTATKSNDYFWIPKTPEMVIGKGDTLRAGEACLWANGEELNFVISTPTSRKDNLGRPLRNLAAFVANNDEGKEKLCALCAHCLMTDDWTSNASNNGSDFLIEGIETLCGGEKAMEQGGKGFSPDTVKNFLDKWTPVSSSTPEILPQLKRKVIPRKDLTQRQEIAKELFAWVRRSQDFLVALVNKRSIESLNHFIKGLGVDEKSPLVIIFSQDDKVSCPQNIPLPVPKHMERPEDSGDTKFTPIWIDRILLGIIIALLGSLVICCSRIIGSSVSSMNHVVEEQSGGETHQ